ncbi:MAG: ABC transporter ATP-binding protein [Candidatus Hodarchaeales archaeon]
MKLPFRKYFVLLRQYLAPYRVYFFVLFFLVILDIGFALINPQIIRYYLDTFDFVEAGGLTTPAANKRLLEAAILYILLAALQQVFFIAAVYLTQLLAWGSTNQLRMDLAAHCVNLDMTFHNQHTPGKMIERIDGDVTTLSTFFSQFSMLIVTNLLLIIGILFVLFLEDWRIGLAFTVFCLSTLLILYKIWNYASPFWKKVRQSSADLMGYVEEAITGKEDAIANGATPYIMKRFHEYSKSEYDITMRAALVSRMIHISIMGIVALGTTMVFATGIPLYQGEVISLGTVFLINQYVAALIDPMIRIVREAQQLTRADASIDRVTELFAIQTQIKDKGNFDFGEDKRLHLKFDNLAFSYSKTDPTVESITFHLEPGKKLGLIGRTGSGKTTISRLLFRLYDPTSGGIYFNNINIKDYQLSDLRNSIAYVTQQVEIFQASVRDNITLFDKSFSDTKILNVIDALKLHDWFEKLKEGLDTKLLSGEAGFSAGEAQLLALTRVFMKNPRLVILDEASSRLDPATEKLIEKAIDKLLENRTAIIIAHRLQTLEHVDDIMLLEDGKVREYGARLQLLKDPKSKYSQLLRTGIEEVLV